MADYNRYSTSYMVLWTKEDKERRDKEIEILKLDNCTEVEAIKHLNNGTVVYSSIEEYIDSLIESTGEAMAEEYGTPEEITNILLSEHSHFGNTLVRYEGNDYVIVYSL